MRIGSLIYATDQGLGILAKSFVNNGVVTHPIIVWHGRHENHPEWYPNAPVVRLPHGYEIIAERLRGLDAVLFFETPFDWRLVGWCRQIGVKTAIMPMHECMPATIPYQPDLWLCPSALDLDWAKSQTPSARIVQMPVPVDVPWRLRERAEVFVHNAGHGGLRGRNGTTEIVEAMRLVRSPAKLILSAQKESLIGENLPPNIEVRPWMPYEELWRDGGIGDVFIFPEKFNGLSLPLQEARAAGMLVVATDRYPMTTWLPREPLIPVAGFRRSRIGPAYSEFDEAIVEPAAIAAKIDEWYGRDIREYSFDGARWALDNSWDNLKPLYVDALRSL